MPSSRSRRSRASIRFGGGSQRRKYYQPWKNWALASSPLVHWVKVAHGCPSMKRRSSQGDDFRNKVPRFDAENRKANQALVDVIGKFAQQKKAPPRTGCTGLAPGPEAMDCSDSRHHENFIGCVKTSERFRSNLAQMTSTNSKTRRRKLRFKGPAIPSSYKK